MKKQEFIKTVATNSKTSQDTVSKILDAMIDVITTELKEWREVNITGFWVFKVSQRKERTWVVPRTNEKITIPAMKIPVFRAGKTFKENIKE